MSTDKRMAAIFLAKYIGADEALAAFAQEAAATGDNSYLEDFVDHLDEIEEALASVIWWAKKAKGDVLALSGRAIRGRVKK